MSKYTLTNFLHTAKMPTLTSGVGTNYGGGNAKRPNHRGNDYAGEPNLAQALLGCRANVRGKLYRMPFHAKGFGHWIYVKCDDGFGIIYAHLDKFGVPNGTSVGLDDIWGYCGNSGYSTGAHVHLELHTQVPKGNPICDVDASGRIIRNNILWQSARDYEIIPRKKPEPPKPPKPDYIEFKNVKKIRIWQ